MDGFKMNTKVTIDANDLPGKVVGIWHDRLGTQYNIQYTNSVGTVLKVWLLAEDLSIAAE